MVKDLLKVHDAKNMHTKNLEKVKKLQARLKLNTDKQTDLIHAPKKPVYRL